MPYREKRPVTESPSGNRQLKFPPELQAEGTPEQTSGAPCRMCRRSTVNRQRVSDSRQEAGARSGSQEQEAGVSSQ